MVLQNSTNNPIYKYFGSTVPSSPSIGDLWFELVGATASLWQWDGTQWLGEEKSTSAQNTNLTVNFQAQLQNVARWNNTSGVMLSRVALIANTNANHTETAFFTLNIRTFDGIASLTNIGSALDTKTLVANVYTQYTWNLNTVIDSPFIRVNGTRTGAPGVTGFCSTVFFRAIR